jgi:hypothetical protein
LFTVGGWTRSFTTVGRCIRYKVALIEALTLRWAERARLQQDQAALAAPVAEQPAEAALAAAPAAVMAQVSAPAASAAQVSAPAASVAQVSAPGASAAQDVAAGSSQAGGFIVSRSAPAAPAAPVLASVQQLDEQVEVRGVCDGCGQNVMSNDEGRKREGTKYYHEQCVKGLCGGCGRIVHANAGRGKIAGIYWHHDCL